MFFSSRGWQLITLALVILFNNIWTARAQDDFECNEAYECVGQSVIESGHTAFNAYKSGFGPTTSWTGGTTICRAAFSCSSMAFLTSNATTGNIACSGPFTCSNTTITTTIPITCAGVNSCSFSNLTSLQNDTGVTVSCNALQSCAYANIRKMATIHADASYSLYKANIDTKDSSSNLNLFLRGYYAGYGATLTCRSGVTCTINCYAYNSCFMFYIDCIGTCIINTQFNGMDTIAPITNISRFLYTDLPISILLDSMAFSTNNERLCNTQATSVTSDDYYERLGNNIRITEGPICCRGRYSCKDGTIQYTGSTGQFVTCGAHEACRNTNIDTNNGTLFCAARLSCREAIVSNAAIIHCMALYACQDAIIHNIS